jgi:hypothetical protein
MVVASAGLYFLEFVHRFYLRSLVCSILIRCWILGIYEFLELLCCVGSCVVYVCVLLCSIVVGVAMCLVVLFDIVSS